MTPLSLRSNINRLKDRVLSFVAVRVSVGTIEELGRNDASHLAAGVAYFAILSLFPLLLGFISLAGLFLPSDSVREAIITFIQQNLPISPDVVTQNIENIIAARGAVGIFSIVALMWTSSNMFTSIGVALNRSCGVCDRTPFYLRKPRDVLFALAAGFLFLLSGVLPTAFSLIPEVSIPFFGTTASFILIAVGSVLTFVVFIVMYVYLPVVRGKWRHIWPGALLATVLFEIVRVSFILFVAHFNRYNVIYGTIGSAIALMVWIYLSAFILLAGSAFNDKLRRWREGTLKLDADKPL
ncbi:membrane protein [Dehalogenimonas formicexedens]|uniref:Membrane protein n=1 Tax=Dehalogenimonas formicexedens TaxID=1839801 RepID=A0A1P8F7M7_9CHLR|nr:YihY/virulence factor BrkB family protein [Dehalogenimonas formicexedens]APV44445.1 membrane protein [Dehalogenimonas formicexedens]